MDKRDHQMTAIGALCAVIGLLLGMIIMGVWGPYAMERAREQRRAEQWRQADQAGIRETERAFQMIEETVLGKPNAGGAK
jgi:hypothetical protein